MRNDDVFSCPPVLDEITLLHREIDEALQQAWLAIAALAIPGIGYLGYTLQQIAQ
jgi:hypothetical protein